MEGVITSHFGQRTSPFTDKPEYHNGIDIACELETPALAIDDGIVLETGKSATFGIYISYSVGSYTVFYAHLNEALVRAGDSVSKGEIIAKTGSTGLSTGPHLHLTLSKNGKEINPLLFFQYPDA